MSESGATTPSPAPDSELASRDFAGAVYAEQVKLLYGHLPLSQGVAVANGVLLSAVQFPRLGATQVAVWLACLAFITLVRGALGIAHKRTGRPEDTRRWANYFAAGALASALAWGSAAYFLYPPDSIAHQVFLAFVLGGMVAGSMTLLCPLYWIYASFAVIVLVPVVARFAVGFDQVHHAMAGMAAIFLFAMLVIGRRMHATIAQSLRLRFENTDLIARLRREKAQAEAANAELRAAQEALRKANEVLESRVRERTGALQEADRRKDEFLATLAHELRNPLAPLRNGLQILRVSGANPSRERVIEMMERQVSHVVRLVDDLLEVSRITRGVISLKREVVDLASVMRDAVEMAVPGLESAGVRLEISQPPEPVLVYADPVRLSQVITNLLGNATKYTDKGGRIWFTVRRDRDAAVMSVRDTGVGMPPEVVPRVFDLFTRFDHTLGRSEDGLGIGLAVVKSLVELQGGRVEARSAGPGCGSEFIVRLPIVSSHRTASSATPGDVDPQAPF